MKKTIFSLALLSFIASSCSDTTDITSPVDTSDKEMISFSMSDESETLGATRAMTRAGFATETGLLMHIQSDNKETSATEHKYTRTQAVARVQTGTGATDYSNVEFTGDAYNRYWDDAHGRDSWLSVYAVAVPGYSLGATALVESKLSAPASGTWGTTDATVHNIQWTVKQDGQTSDTNAKEDLVYARNIQDGGTDGRYWYKYTNNDGSDVGSWQPGNKATVEAAKTGATTHGDGRMHFMYSNTADHTSAGKFDRGHLKFNHALSRITIKIQEGTGFDKTPTTGEADFNFDDGKEYVQINNMNYTGTLNLVDGTWGSQTRGNIKLTPSSKTTVSNTSSYTLNAQLLPDDVWNGGAVTPKNILDFFIDDNHYFVTEAQLYTALSTAKKAGDVAMTDAELTAAGINTTAKTVTLTQGVNYNLLITVDKKQIETITAVLADWSEVYATNENIDNSHITIETHKDANGMTDNSTHQLYLKTEDLGKIYTDFSYSTTDNKGVEYTGTYAKNQTPTVDGLKWKTTWFYEDNKTAYHLRSVNNSAHTNMQNKTSGNTYFTIENGTYTADGAHDYHWGAPFKTGLPTVASGTDAGKTKYEYSPTEGYKNLLYPGVTSVKSGDLNITELHMMSNIEVVVQTTTGSNAVALEKDLGGGSKDQCVVTLTRLYSAGQVDLGTGKITETGDATGNSVMDKPATGTSAGANVNIDGTDYTTIKTKPYSLAVVPQILYRGSETTPAGIAADAESKFVGITIKTPDNNQYYVVKRLQDILASSIGTSANQVQNDPIKRWYPNHKYIYTITVTKAGIKAITCTLADWSVVTGENINIDLED
ncbi:MAG: fimbrillin family protein [Bacteroidales bacterium]|nr:fimbrillin family protein [Bacteroidales bacterium]